MTKFDVGEAVRGWNIAKGAIASSLYSEVVLVVELRFIQVTEKVNPQVLLVRLFKLLVKEYLKIKVIEF